MKENVLILFKPDVMAKGLSGVVLTRLWQSGLKLVAIRVVKVSRGLAQEHYRHLQDQPFYNDIVEYLQGKFHGSCPVMALVYSGEGAIKKLRDIAGATNPEEAAPHTIRGALGRITTAGIFENVLHVSSDRKEAEREIKLWFEADDIEDNLYPVKTKIVKSYQKKIWG